MNDELRLSDRNVGEGGSDPTQCKKCGLFFVEGDRLVAEVIGTSSGLAPVLNVRFIHEECPND
jgi:hypothetical protein